MTVKAESMGNSRIEASVLVQQWVRECGKNDDPELWEIRKLGQIHNQYNEMNFWHSL